MDRKDRYDRKFAIVAAPPNGWIPAGRTARVSMIEPPARRPAVALPPGCPRQRGARRCATAWRSAASPLHSRSRSRAPRAINRPIWSSSPPWSPPGGSPGSGPDCWQRRSASRSASPSSARFPSCRGPTSSMQRYSPPSGLAWRGSAGGFSAPACGRRRAPATCWHARRICNRSSTPCRTPWW